MEQIINEKYQIIEKIGSGGTSVVYKAVRLSDGFPVAIKVLRDELSDNAQQAERFIRESRTLHNLSHRNIVNILDVGRLEDGRDYIAMEYVDGMTLKEYILKKRRLSFDETVDAAVQICDALEHAHENGIIHRDIKPQNILLDRDGTLKVADFGTARLIDQNTLTMAGRDVIGSVHYISPEQAKGGIIDARSDIYSLGVSIFEMATGTLPFTGDDAITVAMKHINQSPRRPKEVNPDIPQCLNDIILKCLSKDPLKRYQTAGELKEDLLSAQRDPDAFTIRASRAVMPVTEGGDIMAKSNKNRGGKKSGSSSKNAKLQKKQFTRRLVIMITGIIAVLALLTVFFVWLFGDSGTEGPISQGSVKVENMVGKTFEEAVKWAKDAGLRTPQEPNYIYTYDVPEGQVMGQSVAEGEIVEKYSTITFDVSGGPEKVKVPLLKNMSEEDAKQAILNAGLIPGEVHYENTDVYSSLKVFKQSVEADTMVLRGTTVEIWIAKSSLLKKRVPNLIGRTEEAAKTAIADQNFSFGGKYDEYSDEYAAGMVIRQEPAPGVEFEYDADVQIKIYISKGPAAQYLGVVEIEIPEITVPTDLKITFMDDNGNEITVYDQEADSSTFEPGEKLRYEQNSFSPKKKVYYLYINGERTPEEYVMLFYDKDGNLVTIIEESTDNTENTEAQANRRG